MGSAGSKAAARSYNAVQAGSKSGAASAAAAAATEHLAGSVAVDAARAAQHAQRPSLTLEEEEALEAKDQDLGSLLDRLGGTIHGKAVHVMPSKEQLHQHHTPQVSDSSGRLPPDALRELLQLQAQAEGQQPQADHLLRKYNVDPQLVQRALSRVCLPEIVEAEGPGGIKAFAEYPLWFQRRSSSSSSS